MGDMHVAGRNVLSCMKQFMHLLPEGHPSALAYEIRGYDQSRIAQQLIPMVEYPAILLTLKNQHGVRK